MSFRNLQIYSYTTPVTLGDWCIITVSFEYQGSAAEEELYAAIGNKGFWGFDEVLHASYMRSIPASPSWTKYYASVLIKITESIDPYDSPYDVYAKIGGLISPIVHNVIYVEEIIPTEKEILEIDITPAEGGYVTTSPVSIDGISTWYDGTTGQFYYGTNVQVTAYPYAGYEFDHWSDEIVGGVSYSNPAYVKTMTEHRAVKAHFREIEVPAEEILQINITPSGSGYVTVSPQPNKKEGNLYYYNYGIQVTVTAYPYAGYNFDRWSGEIVGGVNYSNPAPVKAMTENRLVTAHFIPAEVPIECDVDTDCPVGYVCQDGVCIPEEVPPPPDGEKKFPWLATGLIGGGVALLIAFSKPKK